MVLYTYWINIMHPGCLLPRQRNRYLDLDGETEKMGPGWVDTRSRWQTFVDPFDFGGLVRGRDSHVRFWEEGEAERWGVARCEDGSFAVGTAMNVGGKSRFW